MRVCVRVRAWGRTGSIGNIGNIGNKVTHETKGGGMIGDPFITLTYVDSSGKMSFQRFMLGQIVCWMKPFNGKPGSVVVTTEPDDDGRLVAETPDKIDDLIRNLR